MLYTILSFFGSTSVIIHRGKKTTLLTLTATFLSSLLRFNLSYSKKPFRF